MKLQHSFDLALDEIEALYKFLEDRELVEAFDQWQKEQAYCAKGRPLPLENKINLLLKAALDRELDNSVISSRLYKIEQTVGIGRKKRPLPPKDIFSRS